MSAAVAAAAAAACAAAAAASQRSSLASPDNLTAASLAVPRHIEAMYIPMELPASSRYESQKQWDWNTFWQYLCNHRPPLALHQCSGAHVLEFLRNLDEFGETKVHSDACPFYGRPSPPVSCPCPLRQAWGNLDALVGRLKVAYEENGGWPDMNPFGAREVRLYLRDVRVAQAKARRDRVLEEAEEEADATPVAARGAAGSVSARSSRDA